MRTMIQKLGNAVSPQKAYSLLHEKLYCAILDSSLSGETGRYSIIGIHPYYILEEREGVTYGNGEALADSFEQVLSDYLADHYEENTTDLPFLSGGIGYFSYDYGCKFEHIPITNPKAVDMPEALICFYDNYLIFDLFEHCLYLTARGELMPPEESLTQLSRLLSETHEISLCKNNCTAEIYFDFTKEEYMQAVVDLIDHIVEGDVYIANMTQQMKVRCDIMPYNLFCLLREKNPSPFGGYFHYPGFEIVSASPERFIRMKDRCIETKPIKGTRKRGANAIEDVQLKQELIDSEKDRSELLMIVDLERNDLHRICEVGSVQVTKHFDVETYATVFHLVTTIAGRMKENLTYADLLQAMFPGGSITGAPKIEAMKTIDALEHTARGLYTGSLGYIGFDGDCDLNIVIRTAVYQGGVYHIGIGGGITCESDPEAEYEETIQKGRSFLRIFQGDDAHA